jgi:NADPH:quinone reductase-like Zn-dependent oxidoreductase
MRAYEIRDGFGLDHLMMTERPIPQPGPGQVLVRLRVRSGIHERRPNRRTRSMTEAA